MPKINTERDSALMDWFLGSEYWQMWDSDNRSPSSCGIIHSAPERFERMWNAAEDGAEGSTHAEIIDDSLSCLRDLRFDRSLNHVCDSIERHIESIESWHDKNGSLNEVIGRAFPRWPIHGIVGGR